MNNPLPLIADFQSPCCQIPRFYDTTSTTTTTINNNTTINKPQSILGEIRRLDAGADDYVVKPFDTRHLMARIRLLSRIKRLEQNNDK